MRSKKVWFSLFFLLCFSFFAKELVDFGTSSEAKSYPHFHNHPLLDKRMKSLMAPYLLPLDHPSKPILDLIFSQSRVTESEKTLADAGFITIGSMPASFVTVAKHPAIPGYVFKIYLDSETRCKEGIPNWEWLTRRCRGADQIKKVIQEKKIKHFVVPDKWLYVLPLTPSSKISTAQPVIVMETEFELESNEMSHLAWKTLMKPEYLDELFWIIKEGYGTASPNNTPFTKQGTFAYIDTEYPERDSNYKKIEAYLSKEMKDYWRELKKRDKKNKRSSKEDRV